MWTNYEQDEENVNKSWIRLSNLWIKYEQIMNNLWIKWCKLWIICEQSDANYE